MSEKECTEFPENIDAAVKAGAALAVHGHGRLRGSMATGTDGKIVPLAGEEFLATRSFNAGLPLR
jgi:hypothetical protein